MRSLRDDQVARLSFIMRPDQKKCLDLSDPGTGKTPGVIVNQHRRRSEGIKTLWTMPKSLIDKNVQEIKDWVGLNDNDIGVLDGTPAQMAKEVAKGASIYLCGPTRLHNSLADIQTMGFRANDVDELHMCFGGSSARTGSWLELNKRMEESVLMTGSLINGRLDTAYPAVQSIEPRYYPFGYDQFLGAHAYLNSYGKPISWHGHDRLGAILQRHAVRVTFESIFGKQEKIFETEWVSMAPKQQALFDEFRDAAFLELEQFFVDGTLPGVAMTRARQIMEIPNDFPNLTDPKLPRVDILKGQRPSKLDALEIHFDHHLRMGTPVIVFAFFARQQEQIAAMAEKMGLRAGIMNGETSRKERNRVDTAYVAGEIDLIVASDEVASVGYNWQDWGPNGVETDHVIMASLGFKDTNFSQGYKRAIRRKRKKPLRVTTLGYFNSVDKRLMQIIERKSRDAHKVDPTYDLITFNSHGGASD
jgi:hypothetical protein